MHNMFHKIFSKVKICDIKMRANTYSCFETYYLKIRASRKSIWKAQTCEVPQLLALLS